MTHSYPPERYSGVVLLEGPLEGCDLVRSHRASAQRLCAYAHRPSWRAKPPGPGYPKRLGRTPDSLSRWIVAGLSESHWGLSPEPHMVPGRSSPRAKTMRVSTRSPSWRGAFSLP